MRQSPIQQLLVDRPTDFLSSGDELTLRDRSVQRKWTLCGKNAGEWLSQHGYSLQTVGDVVRLDDGDLIAKVGPSTYFLESGVDGCTAEKLRSTFADSPIEGAYAFDDERAGFELGGAKAVDVMKQTCSFDTRESPGKLIMTTVAGVSCYLLCRESAENPLILIWTDASYAHYLWCELETISRELLR